MLTSALVTHENAKVLLLESDEVMRQAQNLEKLQEQDSCYLQQLATQPTITLLALVLIALLLLVLVLFILYHRGKVSAQHERVVNNLWNLEIPAEEKTKTESEAQLRSLKNKIKNLENLLMMFRNPSLSCILRKWLRLVCQTAT